MRRGGRRGVKRLLGELGGGGGGGRGRRKKIEGEEVTGEREGGGREATFYTPFFTHFTLTPPLPHTPTLSLLHSFTSSLLHSLTQYPVLTLGDDLGSRVVLYEGHSPVSGAYVVEECEGGGGEMVRRLIFTSTPHLAQTEVRMVQGGRVGGCGYVVSVSVYVNLTNYCKNWERGMSQTTTVS